VFEQFPLVDGTLFLSPSRHDEIEYDVPCHLQGQCPFVKGLSIIYQQQI
jgi:hypothetical protein